MTDDVKALRDAIEAGPTPGPWFVQHGDDDRHMCCTAVCSQNTRTRNEGQWSAADCDSMVALTLHQCYPFVSADCERDEANSDYIAAAHPERIKRLLDRLEAAAEIIEQLVSCHDEPTCPALVVAGEFLADMRG